MKFIKKNKFYYKEVLPVYEFNLPAGHTCPFAKECKMMADRETGKMKHLGNRFRCYAAMSERFPAVRKYRWKNYEEIKEGKKIEVPEKATHIRIHASGDFFSQDYFDKWLEVCKRNPEKKFWAFTKSVQFWVNRIDSIPNNLNLTASKGGSQDHLIDKHGLKHCKVFTDKEEALNSGLPIDTDDYWAMNGDKSFALLDNHKFNRKEQEKLKNNK